MSKYLLKNERRHTCCASEFMVPGNPVLIKNTPHTHTLMSYVWPPQARWIWDFSKRRSGRNAHWQRMCFIASETGHREQDLKWQVCQIRNNGIEWVILLIFSAMGGSIHKLLLEKLYQLALTASLDTLSESVPKFNPNFSLPVCQYSASLQIYDILERPMDIVGSRS